MTQAQREAPGHGSGPTDPPQASHGAGSAKWHLYIYPLDCAFSVQANIEIGTPWGWLVISPWLPRSGRWPARRMRIYWSQDATPVNALYFWPIRRAMP